MAKTVSDLKIKVGVEGEKVYDRLKSTLRSLTKTVGVTDQGISDLRKGVLQYVRANERSVQSIQGQIEAFKGLRQQAIVGGAVYKSLGNDIKRLTKELEGLDQQTQKISRRGQSAGFIFGGMPSAEGEKFRRQIAAGNEVLSKLAVTSNDYAQNLTTLTARLDAYNRAQARQTVVAKNAAAEGLNPIRGKLAEQVALPNTMAALRLRVTELSSELDNLQLGTTEYLGVTADLAVAQTALNNALNEGSRAYQALGRRQEQSLRVQEKLARIQEYYGTVGERQGGTRPRQGVAPGAGGYRDPRTGAMIARGTVAGRQQVPVPTQVREISGLYQQIGGIGMSGVSANIEMMGNSYEQVARDIQAATRASNGSINSLNAQRTAWSSLRLNLDPTSKAYREVGLELDKVDRKIRRLNKRRMTGGELAAGVGAVASSAIFGGPEGAIGALAGLPFGPAGAAVGGGIGATFGIGRQSIASTADYAAEVNRLRIALEGVTGAGTENAYALQAIDDVVRDLNVPQEVATQGMTRLSAAVLGAKGNVGDAEVVFKNVTAAVKATGGSADDVNSAITAMVQVFSKGKVSAEELSGQLGERLPGAVTLFAEANNMSMVELQDGLKKGTVGLNELMAFVVALGDKYTDIAKGIAADSVDAGARAQVAFNDLKLAIGEAIQPIGGELQLAVAEFAVDILPALVTAATASAAAMKTMLNVSSTLIANLKELLIVAGAAGLGLALQNLVGIAGALGTAVGALQVKVAALNVTMLLNPAVALAAGITALGVVLYKAATAHDDYVKAIEAGDVSVQEATKRTEELNGEIDALQNRLSKASNPRLIQSLKRQIQELKAEIKDIDLAKELASPYTVGDITYDRATGRPISGVKPFDPTDFESPKPDGDKDGSKKKLMTEAEANLRIKILEAEEKLQKIKSINLKYDLDMLLASLETEDLQRKRVIEAEAEKNKREAILNLFKGMTDEFLKQQKLGQDLNREIEDRKFKLGLITKEQYNQFLLERERRRLEGTYKDVPGAEGKIEEGMALYQQEIDPTPFQEMRQNIAQLKQELTDLLNPVNQITGAAGAIGQAFSTSFINVINGSQTAQEALAGFFQNIANYFLDMASQIITKMITMAILNTVVGLLPGGGFNLGPASAGQGVSYGGGAATDAFNTGTSSIGGNYFPTSTPFKPFAMGGIVDKPTMFAYANGGTGRFGLMGEAGPEAIMPLKRGPDGKLGVAGGGGVSVGQVNITVENTGEQLSPAAQKQIANQVQGIVLASLVNERRSGGILR